MKFDCIAYLNAKGNTLLTRTTFLPRERIQADVSALEAVHEERIYATRSFVDAAGDEVAVEIFTPTCLANVGATAKVEYWRPRAQRPIHPQASEGQRFAKADFALAGILLTPAETAHKHAYDYTESPFFRWNPDPTEGKSPAAMVGDIFLVTKAESLVPEAYFVAGMGYVKVQLAD